MRILLLATLFLTVGVAPTPTRYSSRIVNTSSGQLRGILVQPNSRQIEVVEAFLGVPYAASPTESRRFKFPQAPPQWTGVRLADVFGPVCPQRFPDLRNRTAALERMPPGRLIQLQRLLPLLANQSEDCLNLNIYVPASGNRGEEAPYAIIVWVHGESFEWNAGSPYDGSVLSSVGHVIVVTINYRLGVLGFLKTGSNLEGSGILAVKDIEAALRWIRRNAVEFSGDPQRISLVGHHTGAALVNLVLLSPDAKGLVHRGVLLSGCALSPWAVQLDAERASTWIARQVGCGDSSNKRDLMPCLQRVPLNSLLNVELPSPAFLPRVGPPPPDLLLSGVDPERAMREKTVGAFVSVPILAGFTTSESVHEINAYELQWGMEEDRRAQVLRTFVRNAFAWHVTEILAAVLNEYTDWSRAIQHPISLRDNALEALTDGHTVAPLLRVAFLHARRGAPTFLYHFSYQAKDADYPQRIGSARGDDVAYLLGAPLVAGNAGVKSLFPHNFTRQDQAVSHTMLTFLSNFAKTGDPNQPHRPTQLDDLDKEKSSRSRTGVLWEPFDVTSQSYINIAAKVRTRSHYRAHRMATWLHLVPQLHRPGGDDVSPRHHDFNDIGLGPPIYAGEVRPEPYLPRPSRIRVIDDDGAAEGAFVECIVVNDSAVASASTMQGTELDEASELLHRDTSKRTNSSTFLTWPTALALTLGAGCLLILLNILIFAAILYHRERRKAAKQKRAELQSKESCSSGDVLTMAVLASSPRISKRPPARAPICTSIPEPPLQSALAQPKSSSNTGTKKRVQIQEISV